MSAAIEDERLTIAAGERVRMRVLCSNAPALISVNDPDGLVHLFQDLNFANVVAFVDTPPAQWLPRASGVASFPDRIAWVEATAIAEQTLPAASASSSTPPAQPTMRDIITGAAISTVGMPMSSRQRRPSTRTASTSEFSR